MSAMLDLSLSRPSANIERRFKKRTSQVDLKKKNKKSVFCHCWTFSNAFLARPLRSKVSGCLPCKTSRLQGQAPISRGVSKRRHQTLICMRMVLFKCIGKSASLFCAYETHVYVRRRRVFFVTAGHFRMHFLHCAARVAQW